MTKTDITKILTLLRQWYPGMPSLVETRETVEAWYMVLKDYDYADVKATALARYRSRKGERAPYARDLIPERRQADRPRERTYTADELNRAWRQAYWAWEHTGLVPDDWTPSDELIAEVAAFAPQQA